MERQRQASASRAQLWVLLDETALRRHVGGRELMREQIEHLIERTSHSDTVIDVMPYRSRPHIAMHVSFTIMAFTDPADADIVCVGYPTGVLRVDDTTEVGRYHALFHRLQDGALSPADSVTRMISALKEL